MGLIQNATQGATHPTKALKRQCEGLSISGSGCGGRH